MELVTSWAISAQKWAELCQDSLQIIVLQDLRNDEHLCKPLIIGTLKGMARNLLCSKSFKDLAVSTRGELDNADSLKTQSSNAVNRFPTQYLGARAPDQ